MQESYTVHKGEALFPRIDVAKEIAHLKEEDEKRKAAAAAAKKAKEEAEKKAAAPAEESTVDFTHEAEIAYDDLLQGGAARGRGARLREPEGEQEAAAPDRL